MPETKTGWWTRKKVERAAKKTARGIAKVESKGGPKVATKEILERMTLQTGKPIEAVDTKGKKIIVIDTDLLHDDVQDDLHEYREGTKKWMGHFAVGAMSNAFLAAIAIHGISSAFHENTEHAAELVTTRLPASSAATHPGERIPQTVTEAVLRTTHGISAGEATGLSNLVVAAQTLATGGQMVTSGKMVVQSARKLNDVEKRYREGGLESLVDLNKVMERAKEEGVDFDHLSLKDSKAKAFKEYIAPTVELQNMHQKEENYGGMMYMTRKDKDGKKKDSLLIYLNEAL